MGKFKVSIFESLSCRNFRLYFIGQCISLTGSWIQQVAMGWLVYRLTNSIALLGMIVFLSQSPTFVITPLLSSLIDKISKRKILVFTQAFFLLHALILTLLVLSNNISAENIWIVLVLSLFFGIVNALDQPTRQAFYTSLVPKKMLTNAVALNSAIINGSRLIGPAIGGFLIVLIGEGGCFLIDTISYFFVIIALLKIRMPKLNITFPKINLKNDIIEGVVFVKNSMPIRILLIICFAVSFFILPVTTFFPAYIKDGLVRGSEVLGSLMSFLGIGSFTGALFLASRKTIINLDKIQKYGILISSLILIPFFFIFNIYLAHILSLLLGLSMVLAIASTNTIIQFLTPLEMKGRVMGYYTVCFIGGSSLGNLILGYFANFANLEMVMAISGILCIVLVFIISPYINKIKLNSCVLDNDGNLIPEIIQGIGQDNIK